MSKIVHAAALAAVLACASSSAMAQEHWTEGAVWNCSYYFVPSENWDKYMLYLRRNTLPLQVARKKAGLIVDYKTFIKEPSSPNDWNFAGCALFKSYGDALDFDAAAESKEKAISAAHWKTQDEAAQSKAAAERFSLRTSLGSQLMRQIDFRPLQ
jgi:hypothetical protein